MDSKDYRDYLNLLRNREVRPPFEQVSRIISTARSRKALMMPFLAKALGGLALFVAVAAGGYWAMSPISQDWSAKPFRIAASAPHASASQSDIAWRTEPARPRGMRGIITPTTHGSSPQTVSRGVQDAQSAMELVSACTAPQESIPSHSVTIPISHSISLTPIRLPENGTRFLATVGGAISRQFGPLPTSRQSLMGDAFLGIAYLPSEHSSFRILAGEDNFIVPSSKTTNSISFHDTTFAHGGQPYQNVLGEIQSVSTPTPERAYWLGASYRVTLDDEMNAMRPFAEFLAGGSSAGFLSRQSVGAELRLPNLFDLDLGFTTSELLPPSGTWLTKAAFCVAVSSGW